jgi:hypothetical protein
MTQGEQPFEGTDYTRVKFVGVRYDTLVPDLKIGDEHEFKVRGVVVGTGDERKADGTIGHTVKLEVSSVAPTSFEEPADPNAPEALTD